MGCNLLLKYEFTLAKAPCMFMHTKIYAVLFNREKNHPPRTTCVLY